MNNIFYFFVLFFIFSLLNSVLYYAYLWQLKEYRLDRMIDSLKLKSGLEKVFPLFYQWKFFVLLIGLVLFHLSGMAWPWMLIAASFIALGVELGDAMLRVSQHKFFRPEKTAKSLLMCGITSLIIIGLAFFSLELRLNMENLMLLFASITLLIPLVSGLAVFLLWPISQYLKNRLIAKAHQKVASMPELKVIGITGSFGKSSTKEFLYQILSQYYNVLKTPGNVNVDVGVAQIILKDLKPEHQIMIVEMGAYKIGEIKKIGDMVKPSIGIVTAAQNQHLALFKSLENLKKAKFELIESIREGGVAIVNTDNRGSAELAERAKTIKNINVLTYGTDQNGAGQNKTGQAKQMERNHYLATAIDIKPDTISFSVDGFSFLAQLAGRQSIPNLLAAISAAKECGLSLEQIAAAIKQIMPPAKTMELKHSKMQPGLLLIDDSYNSNPEGVIAALEYMKILNEYYKVIIFPGMLELGEQSREEHHRVAVKISEVCDYAIFTSEDFIKPLQEGMSKDFNNNYEIIIADQGAIMKSIEKLQNMLQAQGKSKMVILFESRGAEQVMNRLLQ